MMNDPNVDPQVPPGYRFRKTPATQLNGSTGQKELDITNLPGGGVLVRYTDGDYDIIPGSELYGTSQGITPYEQASLATTRRGQDLSAGTQAQGQQLTAEANRAQLELQKAQLEYNKAKDAKDFKAQQYWQQRSDYWQSRSDELARLGLNERRGEALLNVGQRPESLWKYLYGIQGQTPPQGSEPGPLPGFTPQEIGATLAGTGAAGAPGTGASGASGAPSAATALLGGNGNSMASQGGGTEGLTPELAAGQTADVMGTAAGQQQAAGEQNRVAPGQKPKYVGDKGVLIYDSGGQIDEPVLGKGFLTGKSYMFAGSGPEQVSGVTQPYDTPPFGGPEQGGAPQRPFQPSQPPTNAAPAPTGAWGQPRTEAPAAGRTFETTPTQPAAGGAGRLLNPPDLQAQLNKGWKGQKFPALQTATGGTSLLPSAQRWSQLSPAERLLYQGSLRDLWGVPPEDITAMMAQGKTRAIGTPRFAR